MRGQPSKETPPVVKLPALRERKFIEQERKYDVITSLYGGGELPNKPDAITVVRATEIRGQLRFWWRACFAGRYDTFEKMKQDEDALWGKAHKKGEIASSWNQVVQIEVTEVNQGEGKVPFKIVENIKDGRINSTKPWKTVDQRDVAPPYAAFPLRPKEDDLKKSTPPDVEPVYKNVSFTLIVTLPKHEGDVETDNVKNDVEMAFWAWETFGGIGARTRRGFGALHLKEVNKRPATNLPPSADTETWIKNKIAELPIITGKLAGVPSLSGNVRITVLPFSRSQNPYIVWNNVIDKLSSFRQADHGRKGRGPSRWPEAHAIRRITKAMQRDVSLPTQHTFPRALFGLPIIFHFTKEPTPNTTLQGDPDKEQHRLASPLILKPLACKDGSFVGIAMLLNNSQLPPGDLYLVGGKGKKQSVSAQVQKNVTVEPLMNETDIFKAFWKYIKEQK